MSLRTRQVEDWTFREVKPNYWKAYLNNKAMTMTGSAVAQDMRIPFFHNFDRIEITQNTTADAVNADSFDLSFVKKTYSDAEIPQARQTIWSKTGLLYSDYGVNFPVENSQREPATYTLTLTGTNTNLMYPILYFFGYARSDF